MKTFSTIHPGYRIKGVKDWFLVRFLPFLLAIGQRVYGLTLRRIRVVHEDALPLIKNHNPRIYIGWHSIAFITPWLLRKDPFSALVSYSKDGEMIHTLLRHFGHSTIRGSSSRGGREALQVVIDFVNEGGSVFITPDGPRGPAFKMQKGALLAAMKTGAPMVPFHFESTNQWIIEKAWDKQRIPKPFSTVVMFIGKPIYVPANLNEAEREQTLANLEKILQEHMEECQKRMESYRPEK